MDDDDHDYHHDHHEEPEKKAVKDDPWNGYYDFIINEGSYKFWAAFQVNFFEQILRLQLKI